METSLTHDLLVDFWACLVEDKVCPDCLGTLDTNYYCLNCHRDMAEVLEEVDP